MNLLGILGLAALLVPAVWALGQRMGRGAGWGGAAGLLGVAALLTAAWTGRGDAPVVEHLTPWIPQIGVNVALRLDGLGYLFGMLVLVIGAVVLAYSSGYLKPGRHGSFYALMMFFAVAMLGLVLADDIVLLYVMWEFTTLCSFMLISRSGQAGVQPAIRTFLTTVAGGLCLLAAVAIAWVTTGTTTLSAILVDPVWAERPELTATVAVLVALAAFTKSAQFPFHSWLPDAMVAITPVSAYLHAAAMVKAGIYLLLRFSTLFADVPAWNWLLITIGAVTALMGAVFALQRHDLKGLLAYSTVSQLGFLVAIIGLGSHYAIAGALVHTCAHALFKSALFMSVGLIDHEAGTRDIRELSGLGRSMPVTAVILTAAAASMAGLPPLFGFVSKEALFKAASEAPAPVSWLVGGALVAAACLTFAYSARMLRPLFGPPMEAAPHEAPASFWLPVALVSGAGVVLGLFGPIAEPLLTPAAQVVAGPEATTDLALWHGINPALFMSLAVIAIGAGLVALRHPIDRLLDRRLLPFNAVGVVDTLRDGNIALGRKVGDLTRSDSPFTHLVPPLGALVALGVAGLIWAQPPGPVLEDSVRPTDWLLLVLVIAAVVLANRARTRITMVVIVGVAGFAMSLYYFSLGAVDVALTQLMVEILTLVMMVLVLARLPEMFHRSPNRHRGIAFVLGIGVGGVAGLAAWALTGRRELSEVGNWYLANTYETTGGTNIVNTILVDFRALDTLGELTVLGVAALALISALEARGLLPYRPDTRHPNLARAVADPASNTIILRMTTLVVGPVLIALSIYFFFRGHNAPGGGFNAALVLGAGISLLYLSHSRDTLSAPRWAVPLIGWGVVVGVTVGLFGLLDGSFLRPLHAELFGIKLTSALLFDLGVYFAVAGVILATIVRLGTREGRPQLRHTDTEGEAYHGPGGTVDEVHHPATSPRLSTYTSGDRVHRADATGEPHTHRNDEAGGPS